MVQSYIRLDNKFVFKKGRKYYLTSITKPKDWSKMTIKKRSRTIGKDVTADIKRLLRKYGSKANMNFKTKPSKKKIRTKRTKRNKRTKIKSDIDLSQVGG